MRVQLGLGIGEDTGRVRALNYKAKDVCVDVTFEGAVDELSPKSIEGQARLHNQRDALVTVEGSVRRRAHCQTAHNSGSYRRLD